MIKADHRPTKIATAIVHMLLIEVNLTMHLMHPN